MPNEDKKQIIIIGNGVAGLSAAINAAMHNFRVCMAAPVVSERSQSVMAMGGINGVIMPNKNNDNPQLHYEDTMKSGAYINDSAAVWNLVNSADKILRWLKDIGSSLTLDDEGNIDFRRFGGQSRIRTAYAMARTGKQIMNALSFKLRDYENEGLIKSYIGYRLYDIIVKDNRCIAAVLINENTGELLLLRGIAVIVATGGMNGIFGKTTGSTLNDAYATGLLFSRGAVLSNLEMIQFHPTTVKTGLKNMLITEAARGLGGSLFTIRQGKKWYFMKEWYPQKAELMPRDVVSRSIYKVMNDDTTDGKVYLDLTNIDEEVLNTKLDEVVSICTKYLHINPHISPFVVEPSIHYFMGGIKCDEFHETNIRGLFAIGECSSKYHGANRLGGNSLLGAICGGLFAVNRCVSVCDDLQDDANDVDLSNYCKDVIVKLEDELDAWRMNTFDNQGEYFQVKSELEDIMNEAMGIYRNNDTLEKAVNRLDVLSNRKLCNSNFYLYKVLKSNILLAKAIVKSAIMRKESRGAHQRTDYPDINDNMQRETQVCLCNGEMKVSL